MWFKVRAADGAFADRAKKHYTYDFRVDMTPAQAFTAVTSPTQLGRWLPDIRSARWLTSEPHGVGSVREVRLATMAVHEKVLIWEPGERFVFTIVRASLPLLKRMVEDYRFEKSRPGERGSSQGYDGSARATTRIRWTIAYQPRTLAMPLEPVLAPRFARMFEQACQRLTQLGSAGLHT
jgi:hypothetical protein